MARLVKKILQYYNNAQQYLKESDWASYKQRLYTLEAALVQLAKLATE